MENYKVRDVLKLINARSPFSAAMEWDNVGLLVGDAEGGVSRIHLALDATDEVIDRAAEVGADLLVTHHPLIFSGLKRITADDFTGRRIMKLIRRGIACVAMHTNYDVFGMAEVVAGRMGLLETEVLEGVATPELPEISVEGVGGATFCSAGSGDLREEGIGRVGRLSRSERLAEYAGTVRKLFGLSHVRYFGNPETLVEKVAVCPGSGKSEIGLAIAGGADVLVTGDIDHHSGLDAVAQGLSIIDAGHYGLEHVFMQDVRDYLSGQLGDSVAITCEAFAEPVRLA